jgi:hypothetical protein
MIMILNSHHVSQNRKIGFIGQKDDGFALPLFELI